jgi:hypothetical protein
MNIKMISRNYLYIKMVVVSNNNLRIDQQSDLRN